MQTKRLIALAWLREEDFPTWVAMDPEFKQNYPGWLAKMEKALTQLSALGHDVRKVPIEPDEFRAWTGRAGAVDSNARAAFAATKLGKQGQH